MNPQVKQFACVHCKKQFKHKRSRDRHVKIHTGDRRFRCAQCDSAFTRSDHLKIHEKSHDANKPHQCEICNRRYSSTAALSNHIQSSHRHESDKKKKNSEIKVESDNVFPLSTNSPTNDENQNSPATFGNIDDQANLAAFWWHSTMAAMTASNSYTAPFNSHFQITNPLYAFQLLAMQNIQNQLLAYEAQQAVARYFENVQQETPHFQCWYCFDHFSTSEKLEAHIVQSHVPMQSPIRCDQCSATFTTKSQMSMHQLELHSSTMHQCFVCMESFANKGKLAEHFNEKHVQSSEPTVQGTLSGNASADVSAYQYDFAKRPSPVQSGSNSSLSHLNQRISNFTIDSLIEKT